MRTSDKNEASTLKLSNIKSSHAHCHCGSPYSAALGCNCFASSVGCDQELAVTSLSGSEVCSTESPSQEGNSPKVSISVAAQDLCADRNPENVHAKDSSRQVSLCVRERGRERGYFYTLFLSHSMHACLYGEPIYVYVCKHAFNVRVNMSVRPCYLLIGVMFPGGSVCGDGRLVYAETWESGFF